MFVQTCICLTVDELWAWGRKRIAECLDSRGSVVWQFASVLVMETDGFVWAILPPGFHRRLLLIYYYSLHSMGIS